MTVETDIQDELTLLDENIMKAARIVALGKTEDERMAATKLHDEFVEQRDKLQAAVKVPSYDKTDKPAAAPDPYARIAYLDEKMVEAANSGEMANYTTMRNEKKQLIREHGRKPITITSNTAADIKERRREQQEASLARRQRAEDEKANPVATPIEDENDLARKMADAAERGDHKEYSRLRRKRVEQEKRA